MTDTNNAAVRLVELVAALSLATDLGMGQPMEQAMRTCLLSIAAGRSLGAEAPTLATTYYLALLRAGIRRTQGQSRLGRPDGSPDVSGELDFATRANEPLTLAPVFGRAQRG